MKKILLSLFALFAFVVGANAEQKEVVFDFAANPWNLPLGSGQTAETQDVGNINAPIVEEGVTLSFVNATADEGVTKPTPVRMWKVGENGQLRIYLKDQMKIEAPAGLKVAKVVLTKGKGSKAKFTGFDVSVGQYVTETGVWNGFAESVNFTAAGGNYIDKIVVTLSDQELTPDPTPEPTPEPTPVTPLEGAKGDGSLASPYNAIAAYNAAIKLDKGEVSENDVYIAGIISNVKYTYSPKFGTATFSISEDGTDTNAFLCYSVNFFGNKAYAETDADVNIKVGDKVVICGKLTHYNDGSKSVYETAPKKSYLHSLNGASVTTGINNAVVTPAAKQSIYSIDGRKLNKLVKGVNIVNGKKVIK